MRECTFSKRYFSTAKRQYGKRIEFYCFVSVESPEVSIWSYTEADIVETAATY
jgi:hypothetical protein